MLCDRMGIDVWEVVDAAATKPFGFMRFEPGPGHGRPLPAGRPVLPRLEGARARLLHRVHRAGRQDQPERSRTSAWSKIERALNDAGKPVNGSRVLLLGVAYKAGVGDMRESPALKIISAAARAAAPRSPTTTRTCPSCPSSGSPRPTSDGARGGGRPGRASSPPTRGRLPAAWSRDAALVLDFRGVTREHRGREPGPAVSRLLRRRSRRGDRRRADRLTVGLAGLAIATAGSVLAGEMARLARRRAAAPPRPPARRRARRPSRRSRPRAGPPRTRSRSRSRATRRRPGTKRCSSTCYRVRLRLRADPALDGWNSRRLVAVRERSPRGPAHPPLRARDPDRLRLRRRGAGHRQPTARAGARGSVRGRNRPHVRRGRAAARPPRRLLDQGGGAQRPGELRPGRDAGRHDPGAAHAPPRGGAGRGGWSDPRRPESGFRRRRTASSSAASRIRSRRPGKRVSRSSRLRLVSRRVASWRCRMTPASRRTLKW